jgi:class 3 adenylate cyclase
LAGLREACCPAARVLASAWQGLCALRLQPVTFLFTDIEGSTALLRRLGEGIYAQVLADHHSFIRSGLAAHPGR